MLDDLPKNLIGLYQQGSLRTIDVCFADLIRRISGEADETLLLSVALVSRFVGEGHICLDLCNLEKKEQYPWKVAAEETRKESSQEKLLQVALPDAKSWSNSLRRFPACIGTPKDQERRPLVLDDSNRLYLHRYWQYEQWVATKLREMAAPANPPLDPQNLGAKLKALFPDNHPPQGEERQRMAAFSALRNRLTIISGGPGTGKTYTVARILALLASDSEPARPLRIRLAAPTGKAAVRMVESIREAKEKGKELVAYSQGAIPEGASTLHRLLGSIPGSPYFRHGATNPLQADVVIVDEASMVDLPMMAKLLQALGPDTRLILLGDSNQLASVEPGYVLGDICGSADVSAFSQPFLTDYVKATGLTPKDSALRWNGPVGFGDCLIELVYSMRFPPGGPVAAISSAVKAAESDQDAESAWNLLFSKAGPNADIALHAAPERLRDAKGRPLKNLRQIIVEGYKNFLDTETPEEAFGALDRFRVLCATRRGPYGVKTVNQLVEEILSFQDITERTRPCKNALNPTSAFYDHQVIMVTQNDYALNLFNGDIGVVLQWKDEVEKAHLGVFFEKSPDDPEPFRSVPPNMLPDHETAFAMTIHKSQGSEFENLLILLPPLDSDLLSKELVYTAITRVKPDGSSYGRSGHIDLWCSEQVFKSAILRRALRFSGLKEALARP